MLLEQTNSGAQLEEHCNPPPQDDIDPPNDVSDSAPEETESSDSEVSDSSEENACALSDAGSSSSNGQSVAFVTYKGEVYYTQPYAFTPEPPIVHPLPPVEIYGVLIPRAQPSGPVVYGVEMTYAQPSSSYWPEPDLNQPHTSSYWPPPVQHTQQPQKIDIEKNLQFTNIVARDSPPEELPSLEPEEKKYIRPIGPLTEEEILKRTEELAMRMIAPYLEPPDF